MALARQEIYTPEEYLALDEKSDARHEYWNGEIYMMSGSTPAHNRITLNLIGALDRVLARRKAPCTVYATNLRLRIEKANVFSFPDVMVICGELEYYAKRRDVVLNPIVIVEVMSDSTERFDHTKKFAAYRQIPSLQAYVMIDQRSVFVECFQKDESGQWIVQVYDSLKQTLKLDCMSIGISLRAIYAQISLRPQLKLVRRK